VGVSHVIVREWEKDDRPLLELLEDGKFIPLLESEAEITKDSRERIRKRVEKESKDRGNDKEDGTGDTGGIGGTGGNLIKSPSLRNKKRTFNELKKAIESELSEKIEGKLVNNALDDDVKNTLPRIFYLKHNMAKYRENTAEVEETRPLWWEKKPQIEAPSVDKPVDKSKE